MASIAPAMWDALAARSPYATPFSQLAFHRAWWDGYGASAHEDTLLIEDPALPAGSAPVAIVPLMHRHEVEPDEADRRSTIRHGHEGPLTPVEPTAKAVLSTWLGMPPFLIRSWVSCEKPSRMLLPPVSKKRLSAAGLARVLVGAIASVSRPMTN